MVTITNADMECPEELKQRSDETPEQYRKRLMTSSTFPGDAANVQLVIMDIEDAEDAMLLNHLEILDGKDPYNCSAIGSVLDVDEFIRDAVLELRYQRKRLNKRKKQRRVLTGRRR